MPARLVISLAALVLVNLVPLAGVLAFGWKASDVLLLFWAENVVIGVYAVLRMGARLLLRADWAALGLIPFFIVHYGVFCAGHGFFLVAMLGAPGLADAPPPGGWGPLSAFGLLEGMLAQPAFAWGLAGIALSHGVSFLVNFLLGGEFDRVTAQDIMGQPYGRVVMLHVTIIVGAFLVIQLGQPVYALALLVLIKIGVDIAAHLRERRKAGARVVSEVPAS